MIGKKNMNNPNDLTILTGPALIMAVLIGIGKICKSWEHFPDRLIVTILPLLGCVANCWWQMKFDWITVAMGFSYGAAAVWGNQWYRQTFNGK